MTKIGVKLNNMYSSIHIWLVSLVDNTSCIRTLNKEGALYRGAPYNVTIMYSS